MIVIDGLLFDNKIGEILVPEPDAIPFRNSTAIGVGIQVTAARGPGFTLTVTRYDPIQDLTAVRNSIRLPNWQTGLGAGFLQRTIDSLCRSDTRAA